MPLEDRVGLDTGGSVLISDGLALVVLVVGGRRMP
jgi:hypothetical protein